MRPWLLLPLVIACEPPLRPPPKQPADQVGVYGCRSFPGTLGAVRYSCTDYELVDSVGEGTTRDIEADLVAAARTKGFTTSSRVVEIEGVGDALLIQYQGPQGGHAFDLLATVPSDSRLVQCHMTLFENAKSQSTRQRTCEGAIRTLLSRPAPPRVEISEACREATERLPTLPGHPEDPGDLRRAMRTFADGCNDKIAACARAAKTYVETTLCRS